LLQVLIVEDEKPISNLIRLSLTKEGYHCTCAFDGAAAADLLVDHHYDLILLDVMLPEIDGFELMEYIRPMKVPVIFLTAKSAVKDRVKGLKLGAEDYIVKPFEMKEVLARIHAVLRRSGVEEETGEKKLSFDKLVINLDSYELLVDGQRVDTPPKELELLYHLASTPNRVYTRNQLLDEVWGFDYFGDSRTVDVHIKRLREKLEDDPAKPEFIKTVFKVGYMLEVRE